MNVKYYKVYKLLNLLEFYQNFNYYITSCKFEFYPCNNIKSQAYQQQTDTSFSIQTNLRKFQSPSYPAPTHLSLGL